MVDGTQGVLGDSEVVGLYISKGFSIFRLKDGEKVLPLITQMTEYKYLGNVFIIIHQVRKNKCFDDV